MRSSPTSLSTVAMTSRSPPPPPAEPQEPPAPTMIRALSDDLLREIFLRLPSLPSLVRAAFTCRAFLAAVRSSPTFRRRFRALHPPPLLGFFFDPNGTDMPSFTHIRRRSDPDLAAAVRGVDVCLTRVPCHDDVFSGWQLRESATTPSPGPWISSPGRQAPDDISKGHRGKFISQNYFLLPSDDEAPDRSLLRVVYTCHDKSRVRAAVFSSATRKWQILPWLERAPKQPASGKYWLLGGMHVKGLLCWPHSWHDYIVVLDTTTLQFSFIDLPEVLKDQSHIYRMGDNKDGKLCIVAAIEFTLFIWFRTEDANGVDKWMLQGMIQLEGEVLEATEAHGKNMKVSKFLQFWMALCI